MTLPKITNLQLNLTKQLFSFRYITRLQFQKYLNHNSKRQTNRHLKILREKGYIRRVLGENRPGFQDEAIYVLGTTGIKLMRGIKDLTHQEVKNRYKDPTRSQTLIDHQFLLEEIFLQLRKQAREESIALTFQTKQEYEKGSAFEMLHPDSFVIKKKEEEIRRYFFEIIDPIVPARVWKRRIRSYVKYFLNNSVEAETEESYPIVLIICPNEAMKVRLLKYAGQYIDEQGAEDMVLKATSKKQALDLGVTADIWGRATLQE